MTAHEQLIREGYEAWNRGDWDRMQGLLAPDFELDATERVLNPESYQGIEGFRKMAAQMEEIWDFWELKAEEFIENGEQVFTAHRVHARGKGSGIEIDRIYWTVWTIRAGKAARLILFGDRERALAAAGLEHAG